MTPFIITICLLGAIALIVVLTLQARRIDRLEDDLDRLGERIAALRADIQGARLAGRAPGPVQADPGAEVFHGDAVMSDEAVRYVDSFAREFRK